MWTDLSHHKPSLHKNAATVLLQNYKQAFNEGGNCTHSTRREKNHKQRDDDTDSRATKRQKNQLTLFVVFRASSILRRSSLILVERDKASRMFSWPSCFVVGRLVLTYWDSRRAFSAVAESNRYKVRGQDLPCPGLRGFNSSHEQMSMSLYIYRELEIVCCPFFANGMLYIYNVDKKMKMEEQKQKKTVITF